MSDSINLPPVNPKQRFGALKIFGICAAASGFLLILSFARSRSRDSVGQEKQVDAAAENAVQPKPSPELRAQNVVFREGDEIELPKGAILYTNYDLLRLLCAKEAKGDSAGVAEANTRLAEDTMTLPERARVKIIKCDDEARLYKVEGDGVRRWAKGDDLARYVSETQARLAQVERERAGKIRMLHEFRLGEFTYEITDCSEEPTIGNRHGGGVEASEGGTFVVVSFTIKNEGDTTRTVLADDFLLRDAKGRKFRASSRAVTALLLTGQNKDWLLRELQPGLGKEAVTAFEVPDDALESSLTLVVPEKGGSRSVEVALEP